ncbi:hypothetical protein EXIGLDRAFT_750658 [Exidia glandulosa HHB12029]|uniref:Kinetochore protein Spc24 n=1 Tax=Exidia glandulosa HHB12029 TaxID=1314781 RepID=A0A165GF84_EXIGL|nr:hypothetical protein EXIGLDRAFT_750658 [Exidia glandulosa HHB12029]
MSWTDVLHTISQMTPDVDPTEDYMTLKRTDELMRNRAATREKEIESVRSNLRNLARQFESAKVAATRPKGVPSETEHEARRIELEASKMAVAKSINDAEDLLSAREAEIMELNDEEKALNRTDATAEHELDSSTLKLELIRGMGFEPITDKDGRVKKVLVRSLLSNEIHSVSLDDGKSDEEHTQLLWQYATTQ